MLLTSIVIRALFLIIASAIKVKLLDPRYKRCRLVIVASPEGKLPVRRLLPRFNDIKPELLPYEVGTDPLNMLFWKEAVRREEMPKAGNGPVRLLLLKSTVTKLAMLLKKVAGTVPFNQFPLKSR